MKRRDITLKKIDMVPVVIWLAIGLIVSLAFAGIKISGTGNLDSFFDVGEVYDVPQNYYKSNGSGWIYDATNDLATINMEGGSKPIYLVGNEKEWKYLIIDISEMSQTTLEVLIEICDSTMMKVASFPAALCEGRNVIDVSGYSIEYFQIKVPDCVGAQLRIEELQLREQLIFADAGQMIKWSLVAFLVYILFSGIIFAMKQRWNIKSPVSVLGIIDGLQEFYCRTGNLFARFMSGVSTKIRSRVWEGCFLVIIFYSIIVIDTNKHIILWKYSQLVYSIIILVIAVFAIETPLKKVCWRNRLVYAWISLWILACISDFVVSKTMSGVGYVQLLLWGFCFFVWNNMKEPQRLLKALINAVQISFGMVAVFCMVCRSFDTGIRYMGAFINPNYFAYYLVVVAAVVLADILHKFYLELPVKKTIVSCCELTAILTFWWMTQTRGAMLAIGVIGILAVVFLIVDKRNIGFKALKKWCLCMMITVLPIGGGVFWGCSVLPERLGTAVVFEKDIYKPVAEELETGWNMKVYAAEDESVVGKSRIMRSLKSGALETISTGRTIIWEAYIRQMNLWGHKWRAVINRRLQDAHNALLTIPYRYGVFTIIPYILFWGYSIYYGRKYMKRNEYGFLPMALCVGYMIVALVDTMEQPYVNLVWFTMYFVVGSLFSISGTKVVEENGSNLEKIRG